MERYPDLGHVRKETENPAIIAQFLALLTKPFPPDTLVSTNNLHTPSFAFQLPGVVWMFLLYYFIYGLSVNSTHIPSLFWACTWSSQELKLIQSLWKCPDVEHNECEKKGFEPCPLTWGEPRVRRVLPSSQHCCLTFLSSFHYPSFSIFLLPPMESVQVSVLFLFKENSLVSVNLSQIFLSAQEENLFSQYLWVFKRPEHVVKRGKAGRKLLHTCL